MYVWIACDLSEALADTRAACIEYNKALGLSEVAFSLPQHLSLKISFEVPDNKVNHVIDAVSRLLSLAPRFEVDGPTPNIFGSILWLRFTENKMLKKLHDTLDRMLKEEFGIPQHEFDLDFKYHSTLFIDGNISKLQIMYRKLISLTVPKKIVIDKFLVGTSKSGKMGEYAVNGIINAKM